MDGRGAGFCIMLGSVPLGPSFLGSPSVKLSVAGCGGVGKGGSCVLIPDLVVMVKVGASDFFSSMKLASSSSNLLLTSIRGHPLPFPYVSYSLMVRYRRSDRPLEGKDHYRCLLQTSIPARTGFSNHIHQPHGILRSNRKSDVFFYSIPSFFFGKRVEAELGELIELPAVNSRYVVVKDLNQKIFLIKSLRAKMSRGVGSLAPVLLEEDASSSKRFLPAIARDSF
ncbi:hypothetical protein Tco_0037812 [Tanacetum coccineum]